jgi:syntaxin 5
MIEKIYIGHLSNLISLPGYLENEFQLTYYLNFRRVGRDLSMTCEKMEKLTQLVKKKSLFDDRDREIEEISQIIKQVLSRLLKSLFKNQFKDITGLNNQIINLSQAKQQVSNNDKQNQDHSKLIVVGLQSKLVTISKAFQNALEIRTEVIFILFFGNIIYYL